MIDIKAPIIPYIGAGNLKLNSSIQDIKKELKDTNYNYDELGKNIIRITVLNAMYLFFFKDKKTLFKITTLPAYKGKLYNQIGTDTTEEEFLKLEPSFVYDDFEEVFESSKGIIIETDVLKKTASWISVFIKDLENSI